MERIVRLLGVVLLAAAACCFLWALVEALKGWKQLAATPLATGGGTLLIGFLLIWIGWPEAIQANKQSTAESVLQGVTWMLGFAMVSMMLLAASSKSSSNLWLFTLGFLGLWVAANGVRAALYPRPQPPLVRPKLMRFGETETKPPPKLPEIPEAAILHWWSPAPQSGNIEMFWTLAGLGFLEPQLIWEEELA